MGKTEKDSKRLGDGNTQSSPESRSFSFTWNNYKQKDIKKIIKWFEGRKELKYVFQEETGKKGTPHLQGVFISKSAIKWSTCKTLFPKCRWKTTRNIEKSIAYCCKEDTRTGQTFTNMDLPQPLIDPIEGVELYEYQKLILDIINEPIDWRTIHWFYDEEGNNGKTQFARHLCIKNKDRCLYLQGKGADMLYIVQQSLTKNRNLKTTIFNFTRSVEDYVSYQTIESIKDGILCSGKYEGSMEIFNPPHIIIFANFLPDINKLSKDRWKIYQVYKGDYADISWTFEEKTTYTPKFTVE